MKKIFLTLIALATISIMGVSAQTVWGLRAAISYSDFTDEIGVEAGPVLYYPLKNRFYINSGLMLGYTTGYSYGGGYGYDEYGYYYGGESYSDPSPIYYAYLPLYLGYHIPLGSLSTYAQVGAFAGYNYAEGDVEGGNEFAGGLGLMYGLNFNRFKVEAGYRMDFVLEEGHLSLGVSYVF